MSYSFETIREIADYLLENSKIRPKIGIICGSGLSSLGNQLERCDRFPYETIPNFPVVTVEGHVGQFLFGYLTGVPVMCMQGRFHYYEGYSLEKCSLPIRVMKLVGATHLLLTNAAGSVNPKYKLGDIMIIHDHINMLSLTGNNPLRGPNEKRFGPRFPPMTRAYDRDLRKTAKKIAKKMGIENDVHEGIYAGLGGPSYETIAELRMLHKLGCSAVGMSTVSEVVTARHCDLTVFAFSLITNICSIKYDGLAEEANHEDVIDVGRSRQSVCTGLVSRMVQAIHAKSQPSC